MTSPARIIDAHQHVFWNGRDDAGLIASLDANNIDKAVLLTWCLTDVESGADAAAYLNPVHDAGQCHPGLTLSDAVVAARRYPDRFLLGYCPHVIHRDAVDRLESAIDIHDVRVCGEWKFRILLDDPRCIEMFGFCGKRRLPVLVHIDVPYLPDAETGRMKYFPQWYGGTVDNLERAIQACPETIFIAHGPGFWREISGDAHKSADIYPEGPVVEGGRIERLMEKYPRLFVDLSATSARTALGRDPSYARELLLRYHERMIFGRDTYDDRLHVFLQSLNLPDDVTENVYHRNAERLFRIDT